LCFDILRFLIFADFGAPLESSNVEFYQTTPYNLLTPPGAIMPSGAGLPLPQYGGDVFYQQQQSMQFVQQQYQPSSSSIVSTNLAPGGPAIQQQNEFVAPRRPDSAGKEIKYY
jgi:hypothetical protein